MIQPCDFDHPVECLPPLQKADEPLLERPIEEVKVGGTRNDTKLWFVNFHGNLGVFIELYIERKWKFWRIGNTLTVTAFPLLFQAVWYSYIVF